MLVAHVNPRRQSAHQCPQAHPCLAIFVSCFSWCWGLNPGPWCMLDKHYTTARALTFLRYFLFEATLIKHKINLLKLCDSMSAQVLSILGKAVFCFFFNWDPHICLTWVSWFCVPQLNRHRCSRPTDFLSVQSFPCVVLFLPWLSLVPINNHFPLLRLELCLASTGWIVPQHLLTLFSWNVVPGVVSQTRQATQM